MTEQFGLDPDRVTPEEFARLVSVAEDDQIEQVVRGIGTEKVLDRVFQNFPERFKPDKARGVKADIQFVVTDEGEEHPYVVSINEGACTASRATSDSPKTTLTLALVPFSKLVAGQANGMQLFMSGKLKVSGDILFAPQIMGYFEPPKAS